MHTLILCSVTLAEDLGFRVFLVYGVWGSVCLDMGRLSISETAPILTPEAAKVPNNQVHGFIGWP